MGVFRRRCQGQDQLRDHPADWAFVEFAGAAQAQAQSCRDLPVNASLAGIGILLLSIVTGHWRNLLLVPVNLPFAFVGGVFAVGLPGGLLSHWAR
jgi:Cu/Ag efflux pump CusA